MSSTGIATALLTAPIFSFDKSFSSLINTPPAWLASASMRILAEVKAFWKNKKILDVDILHMTSVGINVLTLPARPRLLFMRIELTENWPTFYCAALSWLVERLYRWSISLFNKNKTVFSALRMFCTIVLTSVIIGTRNMW